MHESCSLEEDIGSKLHHTDESDPRNLFRPRSVILGQS
jgi:hypothetical protein